MSAEEFKRKWKEKYFKKQHSPSSISNWCCHSGDLESLKFQDGQVGVVLVYIFSEGLPCQQTSLQC